MYFRRIVFYDYCPNPFRILDRAIFSTVGAYLSMSNLVRLFAERLHTKGF